MMEWPPPQFSPSGLRASAHPLLKTAPPSLRLQISSFAFLAGLGAFSDSTVDQVSREALRFWCVFFYRNLPRLKSLADLWVSFFPTKLHVTRAVSVFSLLNSQPPSMVPGTEAVVTGWIKERMNEWFGVAQFSFPSPPAPCSVSSAFEFWHPSFVQGQPLLHEFKCFIGQPHAVIWRSIKVVFIILGKAYHFLLELWVSFTLRFLVKVCSCLHSSSISFLIFTWTFTRIVFLKQHHHLPVQKWH